MRTQNKYSILPFQIVQSISGRGGEGGWQKFKCIFQGLHFKPVCMKITLKNCIYIELLSCPKSSCILFSTGRGLLSTSLFCSTYEYVYTNNKECFFLFSHYYMWTVYWHKPKLLEVEMIESPMVSREITILDNISMSEK